MNDFVSTVFNRATGIMDTSASYSLLLPLSNKPRKTNYMLFHLSIWLSNNEDVTNYAVVIPATGNAIEVRDSLHYVLFNNKKDRTDFAKWLNRYKKWFQNEEIENNIFPELPTDGSYNIHIVRHNTVMYDFLSGSDESPSDEFIQLWIWVIKNCKRPVYVLSKESFAFSDAKEAVYFKLYWAEKLLKLNQ